MYIINPEQERKEILKRYRQLLSIWNKGNDQKSKRMVRKAFNLAVTAHKDMRRKSGEPYIYHPIEVARIVAEEIGLGETSIVCALIHDVVEDTNYTLDDIRQMFGEKVARITDGLTKIKEQLDNTTTSAQAENFRKIILTLSDDVRVILIKLADRLHNMRTLDAMPGDKQLKIASETIYFFAPLAHRLGLYAIKSELEDLALKYTEPEVYTFIFNKLKETAIPRKQYIEEFIKPIDEALKQQGLVFEITGREKSVYSIYSKMKNKQIPFEEVYDLMAVRIIIDTNYESEKYQCWQAYSIVTDFYSPKQNRLRDWISTPKANGYESLHTTVMGQNGQWVEIQIRTRRMNEIAEKGYAAHWKYKEKSNTESGLDRWLGKINELLQSPDSNALTFLDDFKLNLFADEIIVFTPKGEEKTLPANSTALDFAYNIHSEIGNRCIGAKVNHRLVPLDHPLKSGDQIEVITSKKQTPRDEWIDFVVTARAKSFIKEALKEQRRQYADEGKAMLETYFKELKIEMNRTNLQRFQECQKINSTIDLYYKVAQGNLGVKELKACIQQHEKSGWLNIITRPFGRQKSALAPRLEDQMRDKLLMQQRKELNGDVEYRISDCCGPIPGDDVIGFLAPDESIWIHRTNCPEAIQLMSRYGNRILKTNWSNRESATYLSGIRFSGLDHLGLINEIVKIISEQMGLNIRSFHIDSTGEVYDASVMLLVHDTEDLNRLMAEIKKVKGISNVYRISRFNEAQK